jgi:hypothetical protein
LPFIEGLWLLLLLHVGQLLDIEVLCCEAMMCCCFATYAVSPKSSLLLLLLLLQVGQSLDIEVLRGNAKEHVTATLEANA